MQQRRQSRELVEPPGDRLPKLCECGPDKILAAFAAAGKRAAAAHPAFDERPLVGVDKLPRLVALRDDRAPEDLVREAGVVRNATVEALAFGQAVVQ